MRKAAVASSSRNRLCGWHITDGDRAVAVLTRTSYVAAAVKALPSVFLQATVTVELFALPGSLSANQQ
jgi:hypothetical protein